MEAVKKVLSALGRFFMMEITLPLIGIATLVLLSFYLTISYTRKNPEPFGLVKGPTILQKEQEDFIAKVGESIELPEEDPTIATVSDVEKLNDQPFFKNARIGDKILIYTNARKVILYRPEEDRVVEVGTVNINEVEELKEDVDEEASPTPTATPEGEVEGEGETPVAEPTPEEDTTF